MHWPPSSGCDGAFRMKLLLMSSYVLGKHGEQLLRSFLGTGSRAGLVFNALDQYDTRLRQLPFEAAQLSGLGLTCEELDLRDYFGDSSGLRERLARLDLVWVLGGNTFVLARAMALCDFRAAVSPRLEEGQLTYAGYSAAACIAGPDLRGIHLMDDASVLPSGYPQDASTEALRWIPWRLVPHWSDDGSEPGATAAAEYLTKEGLPFRTLRDGEGLVVDCDPESAKPVRLTD